ncbi:MAG: 4-phosphoerythronate dehydrogenase PdxB [Bacteroidales bacterium]|nr:4-phosphoerythronate dehydrogenase PdxB [Bacteroidales bacterium]
MKVIVDDKIPYIKESIQQLAQEVVFLPGRKIEAKDVQDADVLIIRTRTHCNESLLKGSKVRFIATATIGYDHIDLDYCRAHGIAWANAPGCNSSSVAQYIESAFILLQQQGVNLKGKTLGIVGGGNVGRKIIALAQSYGLEVLLNDLPREEVENGEFHSLKELAELADIITFHVPLYTEGRFKTYHLADASFFKSLKKKPIIINTSRGEVIETEALLDAINKDEVSYPIIDVWENEPYINRALLYKTFIGTPHIAGYSADGKANATQMALESCCRFFEIPCNCTIYPPKPTQTVIRGLTVEECLLKIYNPMRDNDLLKVDPTQFEYIRGNYPLRREKKAYSIQIL